MEKIIGGIEVTGTLFTSAEGNAKNKLALSEQIYDNDKSKFQNTINKETDEKIKSLENSGEEINKSINTKINTINTKINTIDVEIDNIDTEISTINGDINNINIELNKTNNELQTTDSKVNNNSNEINNIKQNIVTINKNINTVDSKTISNTNSINNINNNIKDINKNIDILDVKITNNSTTIVNNKKEATGKFNSIEERLDDVADTLTSESSSSPLAARQGKILKDLLDAKVIESGSVPMDEAPIEGNTDHLVSSDGIYRAIHEYTRIFDGGNAMSKYGGTRKINGGHASN